MSDIYNDGIVAPNHEDVGVNTNIAIYNAYRYNF